MYVQNVSEIKEKKFKIWKVYYKTTVDQSQGGV